MKCIAKLDIFVSNLISKANNTKVNIDILEYGMFLAAHVCAILAIGTSNNLDTRIAQYPAASSFK